MLVPDEMTKERKVAGNLPSLPHVPLELPFVKHSATDDMTKDRKINANLPLTPVPWEYSRATHLQAPPTL
jgi:hypothetical protein